MWNSLFVKNCPDNFVYQPLVLRLIIFLSKNEVLFDALQKYFADNSSTFYAHRLGIYIPNIYNKKF